MDGCNMLKHFSNMISTDAPSSTCILRTRYPSISPSTTKASSERSAGMLLGHSSIFRAVGVPWLKSLKEYIPMNPGSGPLWFVLWSVVVVPIRHPLVPFIPLLPLPQRYLFSLEFALGQLCMLSGKHFDSSRHLWELIKDEICISSGMLGMALDSLIHLSLKLGRVSLALLTISAISVRWQFIEPCSCFAIEGLLKHPTPDRHGPFSLEHRLDDVSIGWNSFKSSLRAGMCPLMMLLVAFWLEVPSFNGVTGSGLSIL
ncbi:hypothetical protein Tco_0355914 [Tanacetum coccineum]